ncbi:N-acetyltransferase 8F1-like [Oculina patagonica]
MKQNRSEKQYNSTATVGLDDVIIRSYQNCDQQDCREIIMKSMKQWIYLALRLDFPRYCRLIAVVGVLALFAAAFTWSTYIVCIYIGICIIILVLLYANAYNNGKELMDRCLKADFKDIGKSYMSSEGCHMWVAEWNGKVVGMVGLLRDESHKPGVAELKRMHVLSYVRRQGVAIKLLQRLLSYAKEQRYDKIVLSTTSVNTAAILFYQKYGFQLIQVFPFQQKLPTDLQMCYFELYL